MAFLPFSPAVQADDALTDATNGQVYAAPKAFQQIRVDLQKKRKRF